MPAPSLNGREEYHHISQTSALLYLKKVGEFLIEGGTRITIVPAPQADPGLLQVIVVGTMMAILLYQRGHLVLHGSAIGIGKKAVAFLGTSGAGKSTMAAALTRRGHSLITDDVAPLDLTGERPMVVPGYPMIKVDPRAAQQLGLDTTAMTVLPTPKQKFCCQAAGDYQQEPCPLSHIFVLNYGEERGFERLPPQEAFLTLMNNTPPTMWGLNGDARHLQACGQLLRHTSLCLFRRERDLAALDEHARLVETFLEAKD